MKKCIYIIIGLLIIPTICSGATIFEDDFNSYNNGDLNGQGSWSGDASFDIEGTTVFEGAKALQTANSGSWVSIIKVGTLQSAGRVTWYINKSSDSDGQMQLQILNEGDTSSGRIYFNWPSGSANDVAYELGDGGHQLSTYLVDTWYSAQIEWHSTPSHQVRFQFNEEGWTSWFTPENDWTNGVDTIRIYARNFSSSVGFFDYIDEDLYATPPATEELDYTYIRAILILGILLLLMFYFFSTLNFKLT